MTTNNESQVETFLNSCVEALGGITRKWASPGRIGVPDRIVFFKDLPVEYRVWFVELKAEDGVLESHQKREHERLMKYTDNVIVLTGKAEVRAFCANIQVMIREYTRSNTIPLAVMRRIAAHENISKWPKRSRK